MLEQGGSTGHPAEPITGDEQGWHYRADLALHEVEQLLDWLERSGGTVHEIRLDGQGATVRWRHDPPHRT